MERILVRSASFSLLYDTQRASSRRSVFFGATPAQKPIVQPLLSAVSNRSQTPAGHRTDELISDYSPASSTNGPMVEVPEFQLMDVVV